MVGLPADPQKPSNVVFRYLTVHGYNVVSGKPDDRRSSIGQKCYPQPERDSGKIEVVDIFRKSEDVPPIVG